MSMALNSAGGGGSGSSLPAVLDDNPAISAQYTQLLRGLLLRGPKSLVLSEVAAVVTYLLLQDRTEEAVDLWEGWRGEQHEGGGAGEEEEGPLAMQVGGGGGEEGERWGGEVGVGGGEGEGGKYRRRGL